MGADTHGYPRIPTDTLHKIERIPRQRVGTRRHSSGGHGGGHGLLRLRILGLAAERVPLWAPQCDLWCGLAGGGLGVRSFARSAMMGTHRTRGTSTQPRTRQPWSLVCCLFVSFGPSALCRDRTPQGGTTATAYGSIPATRLCREAPAQPSTINRHAGAANVGAQKPQKTRTRS